MKRRLFLRSALGVAALLAVSSAALATYSAFPGNGRGGPLANQPSCTDSNRGRVWALYGTPNDGTKSDLLQVCAYSSAGTYSWVTFDAGS